jgi:hypothetical protein
MRVRSGLIWLRLGSSGGVLWTWKWNLGFHKGRVVSLPAEWECSPHPPRLFLKKKSSEVLFLRRGVVGPPAQPPSCSTSPCRFSATDYLIHSQLASISGGCLLHPQSEVAPCSSDNYQLNIEWILVNIKTQHSFDKYVQNLYSVSAS